MLLLCSLFHQGRGFQLNTVQAKSDTSDQNPAKSVGKSRDLKLRPSVTRHRSAARRFVSQVVTDSPVAGRTSVMAPPPQRPHPRKYLIVSVNLPIWRSKVKSVQSKQQRVAYFIGRRRPQHYHINYAAFVPNAGSCGGGGVVS